MSKRNGDRARFQKDRKRKMLRRERRNERFKDVRPQPVVSRVEPERTPETLHPD